MKSILDNKVKGSQFKGSTNKEFCDYVVSYFIERFNRPIRFEPDAKVTSLFDMGWLHWGKGDYHEFIEMVKEGKFEGKFFIVTSDKGREFKTQLLPDMLNYLVEQHETVYHYEMLDNQ